MLGVNVVNETRRLLTVDGFGQRSMEERVFDIQLMNGPIIVEGDGEDGAYCSRLDDWAEGLGVVDAGLLGKSTEYPTSLVPRERAVGVELVAKNPLAGDDVGFRRTRNKTPRVVGGEGAKLVEHSSTPIWIL